MILDTSIVIDRHTAQEGIEENMSIVSVIEYPPILHYDDFTGNIYTITAEDQVEAVSLQQTLRSQGDPLPLPDLLVAAAAINRGEELRTRDDDFRPIGDVADLDVTVSQ